MSAQEPISNSTITNSTIGESTIGESTIAESTITSPDSPTPDSNGSAVLSLVPQPIIKSAFILFAIFTVFTGLAYPALVTAVAQLVFPHQAEGSLVYAPLPIPNPAVLDKQVSGRYSSHMDASMADSQVIGSRLVGQAFSAPQYFWPRPSATSPAYNAAASSGSNLGPTNPDYLAAVAKRVEAWRNKAINPSAESWGNQPINPSAAAGASASAGNAALAAVEKIPVDIVTASASGLDPDISPAAARMQIERVARARSLSPEQLRKLVAAHTQGRDFGLFGDPRVNVLELNLALDRLTKEM